MSAFHSSPASDGDIDSKYSVIRATAGILIVLLMISTTGCLKHAVREESEDDPFTEGKSDIRQLEDRLGV